MAWKNAWKKRNPGKQVPEVVKAKDIEPVEEPFKEPEAPVTAKELQVAIDPNVEARKDAPKVVDIYDLHTMVDPNKAHEEAVREKPADLYQLYKHANRYQD